MSFKNEFAPPLEQESSEFFKNARRKFNIGHTDYDRWTVDRTHESALIHQGSGREIESANHDIWEYIDTNGYYVFSTEKTSEEKTNNDTINTTYILNGFWEGDAYSTPTPASLIQIKNALREYSRWHLFNPEAFSHSHITLIDGTNGGEI